MSQEPDFNTAVERVDLQSLDVAEQKRQELVRLFPEVRTQGGKIDFDRLADHVLESISGHLSRRMLEHYSHIRIDAKRQGLDALANARRDAEKNGDGNGNGKDDANGGGPEAPDKGADIPLLVALAEGLTSQSRHSLLLRGFPPAGKLLIPLERRDVRVVEGARLEIDSVHAC